MRIKNGILPVFEGFYNQGWEEFEPKEPFNDIELYNVNYEQYHKDIINAFIEIIEETLYQKGFDLKIILSYINYPSKYNYYNDVAVVEYELEEGFFKKVKDYLIENKEEFEKYLEDKFTSYDGFISFESKDFEVWLDEDLFKHKTHHYLEFILQKDISLIYQYVYESTSLNVELKPKVTSIYEELHQDYLNNKSEDELLNKLKSFLEQNDYNLKPEGLLKDFFKKIHINNQSLF